MVLSNRKGPACWQAGFTLIELLVSISIIATLIALLVPNLMGARERAKDSQIKQDLVSIKNALRMYYNDNQSYPTGGSFGTPVTNDTISSLILNYLPSAENIGFTYYYAGVGDSFFVWAPVTATNTVEINSSFSNCGIGLGSTTDKMTNSYMVCAR